MKAAVLVIDLQKDFFTSDRLKAAESRLIESVNSLTSLARSHEVPVIWVRQEMKADGSDAPLGDKKEGKKFVVTGTDGSKLLDGLHVEIDDREVVKTRYSPFFKTNLEQLLHELGADTLVIAGINTHACVRMATIDAYERDYELILATDCIDSWDDEHHRITMKYLSGKIARPMKNPQIEALLVS